MFITIEDPAYANISDLKSILVVNMSDTVGFDLFEQLLKEGQNNKTLKLYSGNKLDDTIKKTPQDVLKLVSSQLKAIQQADNVKPLKVNNVLNGYKQSCFQSVDKLPFYKVVSILLC